MLSLASQCSIITILHLYNTILHKSATPYVASCKEITMGLNLDFSQRFPGDIPQEKILLKPTFKSLPRATPSSKEKYNENESTDPQIQLPHFFRLWRSLSCPPCCDSFLLVLSFARWALFLNWNTLCCGSVTHCIIFNASSYSFKIKCLAHPQIV